MKKLFLLIGVMIACAVGALEAMVKLPSAEEEEALKIEVLKRFDEELPTELQVHVSSFIDHSIKYFLIHKVPLSGHCANCFAPVKKVAPVASGKGYALLKNGRVRVADIRDGIEDIGEEQVKEMVYYGDVLALVKEARVDLITPNDESEDKRIRHSFSLKTTITSFALTKDGKKGYIGCNNGMLYVINIDKEVPPLGHEYSTGGPITDIAVANNGDMVAYISKGVVFFINFVTKKGAQYTLEGLRANCVKIADDGKKVLVGADNGFRFIDLARSKNLDLTHSKDSGFSFFGPKELKSTAIAITPNGKKAVIGYEDGTMQIWYLENQAASRAFRSLQITSAINDLVFEDDRETLVVGYECGKVAFLDLEPINKVEQFFDRGIGKNQLYLFNMLWEAIKEKKRLHAPQEYMKLFEALPDIIKNQLRLYVREKGEEEKNT